MSQELKLTCGVALGFFIVVLSILVFLGYTLIEHENTIQSCLNQGSSWKSNTCIVQTK